MPKLARDLMQGDVLTVPASMPFVQLLHLFVKAGISSAPIVDRDGLVVAIVSVQDLLRAVDQACDEDVDAGEAHGAGDPMATLRPLTAKDLACSDVLWVDEGASLAHVAATMRGGGAHRVLVGRAGQLAGVLTTFDLLAALESGDT